MTKIEALKKSLEMWEWLAQNPTPPSAYLNKGEYLEKICGLTFEDYPINGCFLCEYCHKHGLVVHCEECPVQWTSLAQSRTGILYCQRRGSPYECWRMASSKELKQKYAGEVADLIRTALEQEKRNEECN